MMDAIIAAGLDIPKNPFVKLTVNEKGTVYEMTPKMVTLPDNGSFEATKIYNVYLSIPIQSEGGEVELNAGDQSDPGLDPGN